VLIVRACECMCVCVCVSVLVCDVTSQARSIKLVRPTAIMGWSLAHTPSVHQTTSNHNPFVVLTNAELSGKTRCQIDLGTARLHWRHPAHASRCTIRRSELPKINRQLDPRSSNIGSHLVHTLRICLSITAKHLQAPVSCLQAVGLSS
jgi:hypothetical protein